ncbi:MAG: hypothetical protein ACOYYS_17930 [Chloroflexota bacterium]
MADDLTPTTDSTEPLTYQVRLKGHLDAEWADWLGHLSITLSEHGESILTGPGLDQAALHGLLKKVRDAGLTLISVNPVNKTDQE